MTGIDGLETLFVIFAFLLQVTLIVHFALRKWRFPFAMRYGWIVYALGLPAFCVSLLLLLGGKPWSLWTGGIIFLIWAIFGYTVEYIKKIQWRTPVLWPVFAPYVFLYLATIMFYWWPLALIWKPLWYIYAVLFVISTLFNVTSHKSPPAR